jgi:hypothetical protein
VRLIQFRDRLLGALDFVRFPYLRSTWGGPFNGQQFRQRVFQWITDTIRPTYIVETGTYRATTTAAMARSLHVPIHTIESDDRYYAYAWFRLLTRRSVRLHFGDSAAVLTQLLERTALPTGTGFYYLDAHWGSSLPLRQELELIFEHRPESIAMIDDFEVPGDRGYGFDEYPGGKRLTLSYLSPILRRFALRAFFPVCPSSVETGRRRGSVILAAISAEQIAQCPLLCEWKPATTAQCFQSD